MLNKQLSKLLSFLLFCSIEVNGQVINGFSYDYWYINEKLLVKREGDSLIKVTHPLPSHLYSYINFRFESLSSVLDLRTNILYTVVNSGFFKDDVLICDDISGKVPAGFGGSSTQGALILADGWNKDKLYIFSQSHYYSDLFYSVYDLTSDVFVKKNIPIVVNASEKLHSIFVNNSFRIVTTDKNGFLVTIVLDSLGLTKPKYHEQVRPNTESSAAIGEIKFSNKGNLIGALYRWQSPSSLFIYQYDIINDEVCLVKAMNEGLPHVSYSLDFGAKDECLYIGETENNDYATILDLSDLGNKIIFNRIDGHITELLTVPKGGIFFIKTLLKNSSGTNSVVVGVYSINCGVRDVRFDTLGPIDDYTSTIFPNIPKVIDSLYPSPGLRCLDPSEIEYVYRTYDDIFQNFVSPNKDNKNDYFSIEFPDFWNYSDYNISIFNRYGQKLYESEDPNFKWDAYWKGREAPNGAYYYVLRFHEKILGTKVFKGVINVLD